MTNCYKTILVQICSGFKPTLKEFYL